VYATRKARKNKINPGELCILIKLNANFSLISDPRCIENSCKVKFGREKK